MTTKAAPPAAPLDGLNVLEFGTHTAAAYCAKLLADLGARVVKLEPPGGGDIREIGPYPPGMDPASDAARDWSGTQLYLDANKEGRFVDMASAAARAAIDAAMERADVFITNHRREYLREIGLDPEEIRRRHPHLIVATISEFGSWGQYSSWHAYGLNAEATGGGCTIGEITREPLRHPWGQVHIQGGAHAAAAILAALNRPSGQGEWVDIGEADIWGYHVAGGTANTWVFHGRARRRNGRRLPNPYPSGGYECQDGWVNEHAIRGSEWKRFLLVLGDGTIPEWSRNPRYANRRRNSIEYSAELDELQRPWLMSHTRAEIFDIARQNRLPFAPVYRLDEAIEVDHLHVRDHVVNLPTPDGKSVQAPGAPYVLSDTPWSLRSAAPRLDSLRQLSEAALPFDTVTRQPAGAVPDRAGLPLKGVRVLDLTAVIAGPQCARMLADMGAEVIKIESRAHPDALRTSENNIDGNPEHDSLFHFMNRHKKGITLNLRTREGRRLFLELARGADIVIENFASRVMPLLGLDHRTLARYNPRIILVSMPGPGDTGPLREMVSYAGGMNAVSGLDSLAGYPGEDPMMVTGAYCDWSSAVHAGIAALAALRARSATGRGQYVNVAQWEVATSAIGPAFLQYTLGGEVPGPNGNRDIYYAPHGLYPAAQDDSWVAIACATDAEWQALCQVAGHAEWADCDAFATRAARLANQHELDELLGEWTRQAPRDELVEKLQAGGVAATPALEIGERWSNPHFADREGFVEVVHPTMGVVIVGGAPWKFQTSPIPVRAHGPFLGQHNEEIFQGLLGLSPEEIADRESKQVIY